MLSVLTRTTRQYSGLLNPRLTTPYCLRSYRPPLTTVTGRRTVFTTPGDSRKTTSHTDSIEKQYSATLQLPCTDFPLRANAVKRAPQFRERCTDRLYSWQQTSRLDAPEFTLHDGHALNKILKDIILRYKILRGYRVNYVPGWDCHGLPIEQKALATVDRNKMTPMQIREQARNCALEAVEQQKKQFRSWSILGDWDHSYMTLTPIMRQDNYETALAEAELEYKDNHKSRSVYVEYPLAILSPSLRQLVGDDALVSALIWTTTPWTLPANTAIAVGNELAYAVVEKTHDASYFIVAADRLEALQSLLGEHGATKVVAVLHGRDIVGCQYEQPINRRICSIWHGDHVTSESGTGLVHTAPAHGQEDFSLCRENHIELVNCVDDDGRFTDEAGPFAGLPVLKEGTAAVIEWLKERKHLVSEMPYTHSYPYDWRTKQPVILRATWQWFANITDVLDASTKSIASMPMIPETGRHRLTSFLHGRSEWCISRQRSWGVPIPVFYNVASGEPLMNNMVIEHVASVFEKHGSDAWWQLSTPSDLYRRGMDTMDVWFDSGTSWAQLSSPPADIYLEGSDQHRGWFQSSLLTSVAVNGKAPFKQLITHGFLLDEHGHKMSKSIGNTILPYTIIEGGPDKKKQPAYGIDILRLWVASTEFTRDVTIGDTVIANIAESMRKYRSTARFMLGCLHHFDIKQKVDYNELLPIDKYILHELHRFATLITDAYEEYAFNKVTQELNRFTNAQLSAFYFESIKERLYADDKQSIRRRSAQTVILYIIEVYMRALAPIACHLAEEIQLFSSSAWSPSLNSVFEAGWMPLKDDWHNPTLETDWIALRNLRSQYYQLVEKARQTKGIKTSSQLKLTIVLNNNNNNNNLSSSLTLLLKQYESYLPEIFLCASVDTVTELPISSSTEHPALITETISIPESFNESCQMVLQLSSQHKCPRCWSYRSEQFECLCDRCKKVLKNVDA
ncbi:tRNA synthetases class I-domain-containing protein [Syncephalis fuscata]|nr:tRNA synthetases class I-domain-containing protein [Syncephalis fuscata]